MGIALTLSEVLLGATASPEHRVNNLLLLRKLQEMEAAIYAAGASLYYEDSLSDLNAISSPAQGSVGFVIADATVGNRGIYRRGVSSWSKTAELPGAYSDSLGALDALTAEIAARELLASNTTAALATKAPAAGLTAEVAARELLASNVAANQLAIEAAIQAADQARADGDVELADQIADEIERALTAEVALSERDDQIATYWRQPVPGMDAVDFRKGMATNSERYAYADTVATPEGRALRIAGPGYVVTGATVPVAPRDFDTIYFSVRRAAEVVDPAGDAIRFGVVCYDAAGQVLSGSDAFMALGADLDDLNAAGALHDRSGTVSRGIGASILLPAACRYYAPAVRVFGENPGTDVLQLERQRGPSGAGGNTVQVAQAAGAIADLNDYDDEAAGFTFVAVDSDPPEYYIRTGAAGNWAGPLTFRGPAGANGIAGFATHAEAVAWLTTNVIPDGTTFVCGDVTFAVQAGATIIPTLPGARPALFVSPDHWGGKGWAHIEAAWTYVCSLCATSSSELIPSTGSIPFVFIGGRYHLDATQARVLTTAGAFQRVEFRNGARAYHLSFDVVHRSAEFVDPFLLGGTYDMDFGIRFGGNTTSIRQGWVHRPRLYNIQNAAKTAVGIAFQNDAAQFEVTDGWFYACDYSLTGRRGPDSATASGGVLVNGCQMFAARKDNVLISTNGEWKFNNCRIRTAQGHGVRFTGTAASKMLECYLTDCSITGNHADLTTRQQYTISGVTNNGSGKARLAINNVAYLWRGLRSLQISGTTLYDGVNIRVQDMGADWVDINLDYVGNASGTLYHCGFDAWFEADSLANVNDIFVTGGNINSFGAKLAYNLAFANTRIKVNCWCQDCNNVQKLAAGLRGREDDAFEDVPISGNSPGCFEIGTSVPEGSDRFTVPSLVMRCPDAAAGFAKGLPVSYQSISVNPTDGIALTGKIKAASLPTYANNSAAVSGGLGTGYLYKTSGGEVRVVV